MWVGLASMNPIFPLRFSMTLSRLWPRADYD